MAIPRDDNRVTALAGKKPDGAVEAAEVDNVTGRLLIAITPVTDVIPTVTPVEVRDDNRVPVAYGVDGSGDPQSLLTDNRNGNLWAEVTIE